MYPQRPSVAGPVLSWPRSRYRLPFAIFGSMAWDDLTEEKRAAGAVAPGDRGESPLVVVAADEARWQAMLAKIDPPAPRPIPYPAPKPADTPSLVLRKVKGGRCRR
jgi:hypothetical protein